MKPQDPRRPSFRIPSAIFFVDCALADAEVVGACELAGIGPADPLADACAAILATTATYACEKADPLLNSVLEMVSTVC